MDKFFAFLNLGFEHILDFNGIDHMLFVIALAIAQGYAEWKKTAILVTAFTIGHSLSLVLSGLNIISIEASIIEFLIPFTIFITAIANVVFHNNKLGFRIEYVLATSFGLIHGLGFSNYFKAISFKQDSILLQLFSFNVGVELGQLFIIAATVVIEYLIIRFTPIKRVWWMKTLSLAIAAYAIFMIMA